MCAGSSRKLGRGRRSRGRWPAADPAHSAARRSTATRCGSAFAPRSCLAANFRRPLSWRNLDLLVLLSFSVSLWFFNRGNIFASVPLVYPPLAYLIARCTRIGWTGREVRATIAWPYWVLLAAAVFLAGFRIGLNVEDSNVIDVGYAGVIGAQRISAGQSPYGHFPVEESLKACGPAAAEGEIRDRIQTNGRCESANPQGDTYGPVAYEAYLPGYWILGWSGKWDDLPAAHFTAIVADLL